MPTQRIYTAPEGTVRGLLADLGLDSEEDAVRTITIDQFGRIFVTMLLRSADGGFITVDSNDGWDLNLPVNLTTTLEFQERDD